MLDYGCNHRPDAGGGAVVVFCASLLLLSRVPFEFFPPADNGRIAATVRLQQNVSVEYTARIAREIDSVIRTKYPEDAPDFGFARRKFGDDAFAAMQTTGSHIINYNVRLPAFGGARSVDLRSPTCCAMISTGFPKSTSYRSRRAAIRAR